MVRVLASDPDREFVRGRAASEIRCLRGQGFGIVTRRRGEQWEVLEPQDGALVSDGCGILMLEFAA